MVRVPRVGTVSVESASSVHYGKAIWSPRMVIIDSALDSWTPGALSVLRLVTAYLYLQHGVLYCFIFLFLATAGGGSWSIDALLALK
jgi:hypothetical protein